MKLSRCLFVLIILGLATSALAGNDYVGQGDQAFVAADYARAVSLYKKAFLATPADQDIQERLEKAIIAHHGDAFLTGMTREIQKKGDVRISAKSLVTKMAAGEKLTLIDVRTPQETKIVVPVGAELIPMYDVAKHLDKIPNQGLVVIICHSSPRAVIVTSVLRMLGYDNAYALKGGIMAIADVNAKKAPDSL